MAFSEEHSQVRALHCAISYQGRVRKLGNYLSAAARFFDAEQAASTESDILFHILVSVRKALPLGLDLPEGGSRHPGAVGEKEGLNLETQI